jgi:anti-sigma B factor antagonist
MSKQSASMQVAVFDKVVCIKIIGRADFTGSLDFKRVINELYQHGYKHFVLDLSQCGLMDSTFLGVLAGAGLKFAQNGGGPEALELWNPNPRLTDLLEDLGVSHLFKTVRAHEPLSGPYEELPQHSMDNDRVEVTRTCLEAHRTLMSLSDANKRKFKDVAQFLSEDLKKSEHEQEKVAH